jgi:2-polyprenyl-3-methyl-5-hydroxy-6-metoxy-1,4-benzoquinol methylase
LILSKSHVTILCIPHFKKSLSILPMTDNTLNSPRISDTAERRAISICNLCGHHENTPFCPDNGRGLVQCNRCGLVYVGIQPKAEELYALYGETYFHNDQSGEVGYTNYIADEDNIRITANRRMAFIERFAKNKGRMLDVGCAMGFFLDVASQRGWQVEGMDVSNFAVDYVQERFGHTAHVGSLTEMALPENSYDLITMFDVIEHVPDPQANMKKIATLLKSGGIYELATPDVGSIPARLTGKRWIGYKMSDEHVYYFSVATLTKMLNQAGFDVVHVRHIGKYVTLKLFLDRLGFYLPFISRPLQALERAFGISKWSFYVNPLDIVAITARKR